ncbi:SAM-dependent methyltransferase [Methylacidiphilum infernorum V4]|uniref:SAM-dependent methyltransferase n=1 Tax=Methylacidiphilum infernorum (isolate V4) TaxID=481448 RepID=B3DZ30_METI4|nr:SAM-dependent methyltransferase [Methylacidiphilum infernorum V4]
MGPPDQYDFMGATQFRLLCALGLRAHHRLLDFGCGSLRAGKLFIPYLDKGNYFGIEPASWLIKEALRKELGKDIIRIKQPHFNHNRDFKTDVFGVDFDYILAQSIFSHAGRDLILKALKNFARSLKSQGLIAATFIEGEEDFEAEGWIYPGIVSYRPATIERCIEEAALCFVRLPWYHPRQSWYLLAKDKSKLPSREQLAYLTGAVYHEPFFEESLKKDLLGFYSYRALDKAYLELDKTHLLRTRNLRLIPTEENRRGGKYAYGEWAHVIGIFQTLIYQNLDKKEENLILDMGCGTGLLAIASEPFLGEKGAYYGVDVRLEDIEFCSRHYDSQKFHFIDLKAKNPHYAPLGEEKPKLPFEDDFFDLVTALSVWTHLSEEDSLFYFSEISRVMKRKARAIVTFFLLDESYEKTLPLRTKETGKYHMTEKNRWVFNKKAYGSGYWFCPEWAEVPEEAIGLKEEALQLLLKESSLKICRYYPGNWKEIPGVFFQDVVIFEKE